MSALNTACMGMTAGRHIGPRRRDTAVRRRPSRDHNGARWSERTAYRSIAVRRRRGRLVVCAVVTAGLIGAFARVAGPSSATPGVPDVRAAAYVVMDGRSQRVLADRDGERRLPVASLTKLMTARLVLQTGDLSHLVQVPASRQVRDESVIGLREGEYQPRDVLFRAMLIVSAGDGADALARDVAGTQAAFVDRMNDEAQRLGLRQTRYANPVGLDDESQHSSALDTAHLAHRLMQDPTFRDAVRRRSATLHGRQLPATNTLLGRLGGMDGVKTGHTHDAGWCMAASISRGGRRIYVVVLGAPTTAERDRAVSDLTEWAFSRAASAS